MAESAQDVRRMALGVLQSRLMDGRQLMEEFRSVLGRDHNIRHSFTAAQTPGNSAKNRYANVLPYDHNRVLLRPCSVASNASHPPASSPSLPDYINASHVVHDDQQCGFSARYIASQGPLATTVPDFWRMCWSEGVGAVVMLTNTVERGVTKCSPYYPVQPGTRLPLRGGGGGASGGVSSTTTAAAPRGPVATVPQSAAAAGVAVEEVMAVNSNALHGGDLTHTQLRLLAAPPPPRAAASSRDVTHLRYNAWPDHGTPADAAAIRTMCDLLEPVRSDGGAVVVHCSAGIGRTGTFCAIDILRRRIDHLAECAAARPGSVGPDALHAALDLPELVHSLRRQRGGMVQTLEQYAFCYQAVYEELAAAVAGGEQGGGGGGGGTPPRATRRRCGEAGGGP